MASFAQIKFPDEHRVQPAAAPRIELHEAARTESAGARTDARKAPRFRTAHTAPIVVMHKQDTPNSVNDGALEPRISERVRKDQIGTPCAQAIHDARSLVGDAPHGS